MGLNRNQSAGSSIRTNLLSLCVPTPEPNARIAGIPTTQDNCRVVWHSHCSCQFANYTVLLRLLARACHKTWRPDMQ